MKKIVGIGLIVLILFLSLYVFGLDRLGYENLIQTEKDNEVSNNLIPVESITHGHGLAVDVADSSKLYIATHHGLLVLINETDLYQIGEKEDDYMGFSPHPSDPNIFFTSGHPSSGGNLGVQRSEDGGITWSKISNGVNGPVDFHAMTISPANPDLVYGWYQGTLQRSLDQGSSWEIVSNTDFVIVNIAADSTDENIVYAASPQGLFISNNNGSDWNRLLEGAVSVVAVHPQDSQTLLSFSEQLGMAKSSDTGESWERVNENFNEETPLFIAFDKQRSENVYVLTEKNSIYKSTDGGTTWNNIR